MQFCEGSASGVNKWRPRPPKCWNNVAVDRSPRCCFNRGVQFAGALPWAVRKDHKVSAFLVRAIVFVVCGLDLGQ